MESRNAGLTYTVLSRIESWLAFALATPVEINRIVGINDHKDGPMRDAEAARLQRLVTDTRTEFAFLDSRNAFVGVLRLVDLLSADGLWDGVHRRIQAEPDGQQLGRGMRNTAASRAAAAAAAPCTSGPRGAPCAACAVGACVLPEQHEAALTQLRACGCPACSSGRSLLARVPLPFDAFAHQCRQRRLDTSRSRPVAPEP